MKQPLKGPKRAERNDQRGREQQELAFWATSETERPGVDSLDVFTNKMSEARVLLEKLAAFKDVFSNAETIIELGGGQCWASCIVRREFPHAHTIVGTDIARDAVVSVRRWAAALNASPDAAMACRSNQLPFANGSVDLIFVFAAAHHFGTHRQTFQEIQRVLRSGGTALYLHEPSCNKWIYPFAYRRVTAKRPVVPEDVLRIHDIRRLAIEAALVPTMLAAPTTTYRGAVETVYYLVLQRIRVLQRILPCTADFVFTKP